MSKLVGELTAEQKSEVKYLIFKMKELNSNHPHKMNLKNIKFLESNENEKLYKYYDHISRLICMYPNHLKYLRMVANLTERELCELIEEAVQEMIIWCMTYTWRTYDPDNSENPGKPEAKIYSDANYGFIHWSEEYKSYCKVLGVAKDAIDELNQIIDGEINPTGKKTPIHKN